MPTDPIANIIASVLLAQLVLGGIQLFGFHQVNKRFVATEFPAHAARIDGRFGVLEKQQEAIWAELRQVQRIVDRHEVILERRGTEDLDDTRSGTSRDRRRRT